MTRFPSGFLAFATISVAVTTALTGCNSETDQSGTGAAPDAGASDSSTPNPSEADPGTQSARIVVDGSGVTVFAEDSSELVDVPFGTAGAEAAALVAEAIGDPTVTDAAAEGSCQAAYTSYDWGGFVIRTPGRANTAEGMMFNALITELETSSGITLETTGGYQVGTFVEQLEGNPGAFLPDNSYVYGTNNGPFVAYDPQGTDGGWGAAAYLSVDDGTAVTIAAPYYFFHVCS